jgi:hypothetical protein
MAYERPGVYVQEGTFATNIQTTSGPTNDGLITFSYYQDPTSASKSWLRFTNQYNVSWGNATCLVNITLFAPNANAVTSPILTRYV